MYTFLMWLKIKKVTSKNCDFKTVLTTLKHTTGCNASYVGETYRHISTRTHEHLETDKSSNIYRHLLKNTQFKSICDENCFSILDSARTKYSRKLKEGMYIKWLKPSLSKYFALDSCVEGWFSILVYPLMLCH